MNYVLPDTPECRFFEKISAIPRCSGNEKAVSDYIVSLAREKSLWVHQDSLYNLIVKKPASPGYEDAPPVMLEAHLDIVCEQDKGTEHDFAVDPLELYVEDGWIKAKGTTLGADDGCGIAYMLAILFDDELSHPALECVFTTNEETGMGGAAALDYSLISARRIVGLDAAGETGTLVSSAGGLRISIRRKLGSVPLKGKVVHFAIRGLEGGHSGIFIDKERGNSIKLASRILNRLRKEGVRINLINLDGGSKENAIPRECDVKFAIDPKDETKAVEIIKEEGQNIHSELVHSDGLFRVDFPDHNADTETMFSPGDTEETIDFLTLIPNGVSSMNMSYPGLVRTSNNVGVITTGEGILEINVSLRSSQDSSMDELSSRIVLLAELCGMEYKLGSRYPGMDFQPDSPFRQRYAKYMLDTWGKELRTVAGHAGGEGGYFAKMLPGMEMICLGPFIEDAHTPKERMNVESFMRVYTFLKGFLSTLSD